MKLKLQQKATIIVLCTSVAFVIIMVGAILIMSSLDNHRGNNVINISGMHDSKTTNMKVVEKLKMGDITLYKVRVDEKPMSGPCFIVKSRKSTQGVVTVAIECQ